MTVCTGNICRSPMAEVVLRDRLEAAGLGDVVAVDSTGVSDEEQGNPMDRRARGVLTEHGYAAPHHSARRVTKSQLQERDLVLAMTSAHAARLRRLRPTAPIRMYRSFDPTAPEVGVRDEHLLDIDDPWYGGYEDFQTVLRQLEAGADGVIAHVRAALARV
ncbi:low molecular weight protein-tyrosine-phosphatase [Demequina pelophila]|uniref:low molecular weight protein-tyrosine-phosphatase n=1 Tax=Demequina pelophila TaxID=1638984 RepID=UPI00078179BE|nr:low molecular weight protein-tyrosine-phosphatase [Demequina pelophila]